MAPIPPATPLTGVTVLDFTRYLSGPFTTMILRDLGARVVKLEPPKGDPARNAGPFQNDDSAYFHAINRGKESVVVDFRSGDEVDRLRALMADVDCVVENFRPGVMQAMGLGPEARSSTQSDDARNLDQSRHGRGETWRTAELAEDPGCL